MSGDINGFNEVHIFVVMVHKSIIYILVYFVVVVVVVVFVVFQIYSMA